MTKRMPIGLVAALAAACLPALSVAQGAGPVVTATMPVAGARQVAPGTTVLKAAFSEPMRRDGWSLVVSPDGAFPDTPLKDPAISADGREFTVTVRLEPDTQYALWLNSARHKGFRSEKGVPAAPYHLQFHTGPAAAPKG